MDPLATKRGPSPGAPALTEGTRLGSGRYEIREMLDSGGQGYVYRAFDHEREQDVALKQLSSPHFDNALQLKNEFRFLRDLIHPNLVELHELVVRRELSFFTMALVNGDDFLTGSDNLQQVRSSIAQLLDVLAFLHDHELLHRDVNPRNVLVDQDGRLTLLDFGISGGQGHFEYGSGLDGTPRYIAPELYRGLSPSPKSDGYSAGLMLYEALTGSYPFMEDRVNPVSARDFDPAEVDPQLPRDLRDLCRALLRVEPEQRASPRQALDLIARASFRAPRVSHFWELSPRVEVENNPWVGREKELHTLLAIWQRSRKSPRSCYARICGPSGIGKSALIEAFSNQLEGAVQLRGRCSEKELVPHQALDGVVRDLVSYLSSLDGPEAMDVVPASQTQLLAQLFPDFKQLDHLKDLETMDLSSGDETGLRWQAYRELAALLRRLGARSEVLIVIDDLQWADADSVSLLSEVFGSVGAPPCLLVLAHRDGTTEHNAALRALFDGEHSLVWSLAGASIDLGPLPQPAAEQLLLQLTREHELPAAFTSDLLASSECSPLVICEAAAEVRSGLLESGDPLLLSEAAGSSSIARVVNRRMDRLSGPAIRVLELLAIAATPLPVSLLARAVGTDLDDATFELRAARLVASRQGGGRLAVAHDQFRKAVVEALAGEAPRVHEELAQLLESTGGDAAAIAHHHFGAGDPRAAATWAIRAADLARHVFALRAAIPLLELALRSKQLDAEALTQEQTEQVRHKLAHALAGSGRGREAASLFSELAGRDSSTRALALRRHAAEQWLINGQVEQGVDVLRSVQRQVGLRWPESQGAALALLLVQRLRLRQAATAPITIRSHISSRDELRLGACRATWSVSLISTVHGAANSARYLAEAMKVGSPLHLAMAFAMDATYRASMGSSQESTVRAFLARARDIAENLNDREVDAMADFSQNQCEYLLGRFVHNAGDYPDVERKLLSSSTNLAWELNAGRIFYASSLFNLGRHRELDESLDAWGRDGRLRGDDFTTSAMLLIKAQRTALDSGDLVAVDAEIESALSLWRAPYFGFHGMTAGFARVFSRLAMGMPEAALDATATLRPRLRRAHMLRVQLIRSYLNRYEALALLGCARNTKDPTGRRRLLGRARALGRTLAAEGVPWSDALAEQILASAKLLDAPDLHAIDQLESAAQLFEQLGLRLHAAAIHARVHQFSFARPELTPSQPSRPDRPSAELRRQRYADAAAAFDEAGCVDWERALGAYSPPLVPAALDNR